MATKRDTEVKVYGHEDFELWWEQLNWPRDFNKEDMRLAFLAGCTRAVEEAYG